jgi:hypothetical protein
LVRGVDIAMVEGATHFTRRRVYKQIQNRNTASAEKAWRTRRKPRAAMIWFQRD